MRLGRIVEKGMRGCPEKTAVICDNDAVSYGELYEKTCLFARVLKKMGIQKGDKVSFLMGNSPFIVYGYLGCFKSGIVAVPSSYFSSMDELVYETNSCGSRIYFVSRERYEVLKGIKEKTTIERIVVIDGEADKGDLCWDDLIQDVKPVDIVVNVEPDEPAMILYTSGSTGKSKGVIHTHRSIMGIVKGRCATLRHQNSDVMFTTSYLCHGAASGVVLFPMLYVCGTALFTSSHDIDSHVDLMVQHRVSHMAASPMDWRNMLLIPGINQELFSALKYATTGGDEVPLEIQELFKKLSGIPLVSSLGMTECGGFMTTPPHGVAKNGSIGMPVEGVSLRLVDGAIQDVPKGELGQILVKGENVMSGYYNDDENTQNAFVDGWFISGDVALQDDDGYYYFKGRIKNIIVRDTGNINPGEVEHAITKHPDIDAAIVVGVKDEDHGEAIFAFVIPRDINTPPLENELSDFVKKSIAERKVPQYWNFMENFLNQTSLKKVDLKAMKKMAANIVVSLKDKS